MSEEQNEIDVYQSNRFEKTLNKLSHDQLKLVEDEIDKVISNPLIGQKKKGDLAHVRVHKFKSSSFEYLLGYTWQNDMLELYLLQLSSHENFYQEMKKKRKADLKLMKP